MLFRSVKKNLILSLYANKGGVGKTTSTLNMARSLINFDPTLTFSHKVKVLIVDLDTQMNTTSFILDEPEFNEHQLAQEDFLDLIDSDGDIPPQTIGDSVLTILYHHQKTGNFSNFNPKRWKDLPNGHVDLIKGAPDMSSYELEIGSAMANRRVSPTITIFQNFIKRCLKDYHFVFLDLSPSLTPFNHFILGKCDYIVSPVLTDLYSKLGFRSIQRKFKKMIPFIREPYNLGYFTNRVGIKDGKMIKREDAMNKKIKRFITENKMEVDFLGPLEDFESYNTLFHSKRTTIIDVLEKETGKTNIHGEKDDELIKIQILYQQFNIILKNMLVNMDADHVAYL